MSVVFDGENLLIKVNQGVTTLDIQADIYSAWKEWVQTGSNSKFLPALRTIGGDPTVEQKVVAPYFFLMNGWKIKPYGENHTLNLIGNLFVDEPETYGTNVVVSPDGQFTVLVNMSTTSDASVLMAGSGVTEQDKEDIADLVESQTGQAIKAKTDLLPTDPASEGSVQTVDEDLIRHDMEIKGPVWTDESLKEIKEVLDQIQVQGTEAPPCSKGAVLEKQLNP